MKRLTLITITVLVFVFLLAAVTFAASGIPRTPIDWAVIKILTVQNSADINGDMDMNANTLTNIGDTGTDFDSAGGLTLAGVLDVSGATTFGAVTASGASAFAGVTTTSDLTVSPDSTGGNAGAKNEISGLPRIGAQPTNSVWSNGTTETVDWMDATPTGEWAEVDAGTNIAVTKSITNYREATESLKIAFSDVVEDDGIDATAPAQDDWSAVDSFGFWIYSDVALTSGDFDLTVDDSDGTDQTYTIGAVTADFWTWVEIDISGCNANCDTVDGVFILATAQGETNLGGSALNMYLDNAYKWDVGDEEALGAAILDHGVLFVLALADANTGVHNQALLVEGTDYFVHYESGNDFIVAISDQSANSATAFYAY